MGEIIYIEDNSEILIGKKVTDIRFFSKTEFEIPRLQKKIVETFQIHNGKNTHYEDRER